MNFCSVCINLFLFLTLTPVSNYVNVTLHPALQSLTTEMMECERVSPGTEWHACVCGGKSGIFRSRVYNACTLDTSGSLVDIGYCATVLLILGASVRRKWVLMPESSIVPFWIFLMMLKLIVCSILFAKFILKILFAT